jgi:hypothetical protein
LQEIVAALYRWTRDITNERLWGGGGGTI